MAVTTTSITNPMTYNLTIDTDCDNTGVNDIGTGAITIYSLHLNNAANSGAVYFKAYNSISPAVGTDHPELVVQLKGTQVFDLVLPGGVYFSTGFSFICVGEGGTGGTGSPTSDVIVRVVSN